MFFLGAAVALLMLGEFFGAAILLVVYISWECLG